MAELKQPGEWIADRFQVFEVHQGGMSVVYVVNDHFGTTGRQLVALKTLRDDVLRHRVRRTRFATECRLWVQLGEHPNIVQAHSVEIFAGRPYVVLELIRGGDLNRWIRSPRLDLIQALRFGVHFCLGLEHGLRQGLSCHRDVKPANLLISGNGILKLTDFGLANLSEEMVAVRANSSSSSDDGSIPLAENAPHQMIRWSDPRDHLSTPDLDPAPAPDSAMLPSIDFDPSDEGIAIDMTPAPAYRREGQGQRGAAGDAVGNKRLTQDGVRIGTAVYMAPEQFRDPSSVDVRADIYSFGAVLFEMITGYPPFKAKSIEKLEYLHSTAPVPPIADAIPPKLKKLTPEIEAVIKRCLKKEPASRYPKVSELRKALLGILTHAGGRI